jgi:hypothetical protein
MKLTEWMKKAFAGVLSIGVLYSAVAQDNSKDPAVQ